MGGDDWCSRSIREATPEHKEEINRDRMIEKLISFQWNRCTTVQLKAIISILEGIGDE